MALLAAEARHTGAGWYPGQGWVPAFAETTKKEQDMPPSAWNTQEIGTAPVVTAPDGSEVRILCATARGSMISFTLAPGIVSKPVAHRTVEEIWYVAAGQGHLWRELGDTEEVTDLMPGLSLTIAVGMRFQFRNDGDIPLQIVAVTMPPWPGDREACAVSGRWPVA